MSIYSLRSEPKMLCRMRTTSFRPPLAPGNTIWLRKGHLGMLSLADADFQPWLKRFQADNTRAFCSACKRDVAAEVTAIKRHKRTNLHTANLESLMALHLQQYYFVLLQSTICLLQ
ncbi:uncharacterized protein LOC125038356 [Penaeus chinensis]|uniref:uncharacterized protein LOC125038356 n=1 Tax=Penaeus chinensis TaxID=139456 RepID=UPI001FB771F5|nr:uncharacterized protein LOC125038356 [Penaeus chinensis]